jgi:hypothetical protein
MAHGDYLSRVELTLSTTVIAEYELLASFRNVAMNAR